MSTAYAVLPIPFQPSLLISTTAPEPNPLWVSGTSYKKGDKVVWVHPEGLAIVYYIYESLISTNTVEPGTDELSWLDVGPCNKCAMFDSRISTQTVAASPLVVVLEPGDIVSNLGLLGLIGNHLKVEMLIGGTVIYTHEEDLNGANIDDWWDYYFAPDEQVTVALIEDLPLYYDAQIRITLTGIGNVAIGHCIFGTRQDMGEMSLGARSTLIDYSRKETDAFGSTTFVERGYADEFSGQLLIENGQLNSFKRLTRKLRATPTLYVGSSDPRYRELFVTFGWLRRSDPVVAYPEHSLIDIEVGALT